MPKGPLIIGCGFGISLTSMTALPSQPSLSVTVTLTRPGEDTTAEEPKSPVDH